MAMMAGSETEKDEDECPYKIESDEVLFRGQWMSGRHVNFLDKASGVRKVWQSAFRSTKQPGVDVDGVDIIATLIRDGGASRHFVFVKQYRIPLNAFCLEFPAGLIDANETVEQAGLRELKEETGYTASRVIALTKGRHGLDPGLTDDTVQFLTVEIDGDLPENQTPTQQLEVGEHVQVVLVPCDSIMQALRDITERGVSVEAMLYSFAIGYSMTH
uniref:Nudix hydrolase domain-containing protein n=1 Tax=Plectus sambesii TaxID=2011161 RepID=A0A914WFB3_9BILA